MSLPLIVALAIIAVAAGFHLLWAMGGRLGFSVSLPQRPDGVPVMNERIGWGRPPGGRGAGGGGRAWNGGMGWWRPAGGGVAAALVLLAALALAAEGRLELPLPPFIVRAA